MRLAPVILGLLLVGCVEQPASSPIRGDLDVASFERVAYPVLLRDCGFAACHGGDARPFQVYGPGRTRLDAALEPSAPATPHEVQASFARAVSMLSTSPNVDHSLLLTKPLATAAGGQVHKGTDLLGRNVYSSRADQGYVALRAWSTGELAGGLGAADAGGR